MVSDQAVSGCATPHEGRCRLALSPSIVGLMRNSLSEAIDSNRRISIPDYMSLISYNFIIMYLEEICVSYSTNLRF